MKVLLVTLVFTIFFPVLLHAQELDSDSDGLSDYLETTHYFTDPQNADTDGDGFTDGDEVEHGYSPRHGDNSKMNQVDSDKDYLNDAWELKLGAGLMNPDSDGDLYLDGTEVAASFDPLNSEPVKKDKLINVNLVNQELDYSFGGIELDRFKISSGLRWTPTPVGEFSVLAKRPIVWYVGADYDYPNTKWNLHFATGRWGRFYIHGAYWHNNFGRPMSHGCVNVSYDNMKDLYWFAQLGTKIVIE